MKNLGSALTLLTTVCLFLFAAAPAHAQATRTWISGVGDDANPCSRTAPCKTFAGAISKTSASGEINTLDPGGFGAVTITKAITLLNDSVGTAGILVSGTNGITIAAGANDVVIKGFDIDGLGPTGGSLAGIQFHSGKALVIDHCEIYGFQGSNTSSGINFEPTAASTLSVSNSLIFNNGAIGGTYGASGGIWIQPQSSGNATVLIDNVNSFGNIGFGIQADGSVSGAVGAAVVIRNSTTESNGKTGIGVSTPAGGGGAPINVFVESSSSNGNAAYGVRAIGPTATVRLTSSTITSNTDGGINSTSSATIISYQNNDISGNVGADGTPTATVAPK